MPKNFYGFRFGFPIDLFAGITIPSHGRNKFYSRNIRFLRVVIKNLIVKACPKTVMPVRSSPVPGQCSDLQTDMSLWARMMN